MSERIYEQKRITANRAHPSSRYPYIGYKAPEMPMCFVRGLGKGGNGTVYLAQECPVKVSNLPPKLYAVKVLEKDMHHISRIEKEVKHHYQVACHPNILPLYAACETKTSVFLFCEYIKDGDFAHFLLQYGYVVSRDDAFIKSLFLQLLDGVAHMHKLGVYHGDLKPENILCRRENGRVRLLLADFGISTDEQRIDHQNGYMRGTRHYLPPECFLRGGFVLPHAIDVWSLGIILYVICVRNIPWGHASPRSDPCFYAFVANSKHFWTSLPLSRTAKALFKIIWQPNPERRMNIHDFRCMIQDMSEFTMHYPKCSAELMIPVNIYSGFPARDRCKHQMKALMQPPSARMPKIFAHQQERRVAQKPVKQTTGCGTTATTSLLQINVPCLADEIHEDGTALLRLLDKI